MEFVRLFSAVLGGFLLSAGAASAAYPDRPVRIVVPYAAGGPTDIAARLVAQELQRRLNQSFIVENRAGAGGNIGAEAVARAAPDGYTLLVVGAAHAINKSLYKQLSYDLMRDLTPVAMISTAPMVLLVNPGSGVNSVSDLVALAKAKQGALNYGSSGNGTAPHLTMELLKVKTGANLAHVPYKGSAPAINDMVAGHITAAFDSIVVGQQWAAGGKLKALAVTGPKRSAVLPDVQTMAEAGFPAIDAQVWYGLVAPTKTPTEAIQLLNAHVKDILGDAEIQKRLAGLGAEPLVMDPAEFGRYLQSEIAKWSEAVRASGVQAE
jgi:tripartite-type tricarboxylate transporter receptor subunit TctC